MRFIQYLRRVVKVSDFQGERIGFPSYTREIEADWAGNFSATANPNHTESELNVKSFIESTKESHLGILTPLLLWSLLGMGAFTTRNACAGTGTFLETMGISTGVGAVVGASTLPFYEKPGKHLANVFYGASAGALVGLGIWLYEKYGPTEDDEESSLSPRHLPIRSLAALSVLTVEPSERGISVGFPLVSLNW